MEEIPKKRCSKLGEEATGAEQSKVMEQSISST